LIRLSSLEQEHVRRVVQLLASPCDLPTIDQWRSSVNRTLGELLHADSAGFILPIAGGPVVYSDEHSQESLTRYPELLPPPLPNGKSVFAHVIDCGVATLSDAYGGCKEVYLRSAYYNEYSGANGAHDTLSALISLGGADPRSMAGLQFWHATPGGRRFGEREESVLRLVFPVLRAGVEAQVRWSRHRADLLEALDGLGQATLVCDASGRAVHQTPALADALAAEPEHDVVCAAMHEVAVGLGAFGDTRSAASLEPVSPAILHLRTRFAEYRITASLYRSPLAGTPTHVLVALERTSLVLRSATELHAQYGLTPSEIRVATLLVTGMSSAEIARGMCLSIHTVRRHTERILRKTDTPSKTALAAILLR
jgi:DNA-binding CsgD family transcriptional regulator